MSETAGAYGLLLIKPTLEVPNANSSAQNVASIVGRFAMHGWEIADLREAPGGPHMEQKVEEHYDVQFFDSLYDDVQPHLTEAERQKLETIWGKRASSVPIYHAKTLHRTDTMPYRAIAPIWHAGRGKNNTLLDAGSPNGINTITPVTDPAYGKRRLLLVDGQEPFFILNGFTAEMILKFSESGERILSMVAAQQPGMPDISFIREHVIGATVPAKARPGSIRYDALHSGTYMGEFPIVSKTPVGIENNIVHFSDSTAAAQREVAIWQ